MFFKKPFITRKGLIEKAAKIVYSREKFKEDDYPTCTTGNHDALFWMLWDIGGPDLVREVNQLVLDEISADRDWNKRYKAYGQLKWAKEKIWKRPNRWSI